MELGTSCSVCLAANVGTGYDCGWCSDESTCNVQDMCNGASSSEQCPNPTITSISPTSGPPTGGTTITVSGTDFGVTYSDVDGRVFINGNDSLCRTLEDRYHPGEQIACETQNLEDFETTEVVSVTVILVGIDGEFRVSTAGQFWIKTPIVTGVFVDPTHESVPGGSLLTVRGSSLSIGNMEYTSVTVDGTVCTVLDHQ